MKLYFHQQKFLQENPDKSALVWSCGTGKTRTALEWAKNYEGGILIICPKALKTNWEREANRWKVYNRVIVTKEEFRARWEVFNTKSTVIVDEVHNGFLTPHFKSQMSKALKNYIKKHKVPRVLLLSATVYTSSPWNIYNLAFLTGHNWNWLKFKYEFFYDVQMGMRTIPMAKKGCEKNLA